MKKWDIDLIHVFYDMKVSFTDLVAENALVAQAKARSLLSQPDKWHVTGIDAAKQK